MAVTRGKRSRCGATTNSANNADESGAAAEESGLDELDDSAIESNTLTVHNVLASASLTGEPRLDLDRCSQALGNSYYNPSEFPALRIDIRDRRRRSLFSISLFESGRIQSTGGCYPIEAKRAMVKVSRRINKCCGYRTKLRQFEIQNILAVFDTGVTVALPYFVQTFQGIVDYEPERFPAARVRVPIPRPSDLTPEDSNRQLTDAESAADKVNAKIRRLMLGDDASAVSHSSTVGGYAIGSNSLRKATGGKVDGEKAPRAEAVHANVFSTGKVTFTGAKSIESLSYALEQIRPYMSGRPTYPGGSFGSFVNLDKQFNANEENNTGATRYYSPLLPPSATHNDRSETHRGVASLPYHSAV